MNAVPFRRIGFDNACDLLDKDDILLLDVRDAASFARGHIDRAENASPTNLGRFLTETPKHKPILIYCYHGNSSQAYAKAFAESGFGEVYSLDGGYEGWIKTRR